MRAHVAEGFSPAAPGEGDRLHNGERPEGLDYRFGAFSAALGHETLTMALYHSGRGATG